MDEVNFKLPSDVLVIIFLQSLLEEYNAFCTVVESRDQLPKFELVKNKIFEPGALGLFKYYVSMG